MKFARKLVGLLVTFAATAATLVIASPAASALTNVVRLQARENQSGTKLCLDADDKHTGGGGAVNVWACNSNNAQKWQLGSVGGFSVWINVAHPGYALAVGSLVSGSAMTLKAVGGGDSTESWSFDSLHTIIDSILKPRLVLEPASITSGARVYLRDFNDTGAQHWVFFANQ